MSHQASVEEACLISDFFCWREGGGGYQIMQVKEVCVLDFGTSGWRSSVH